MMNQQSANQHPSQHLMSLDDVRQKRAKLSLRCGIYMLILNGVFWLLFDVVMGHKPLVVLNALLVLVCVTLFALYRWASYRITAFVSFLTLFFFACVVSLFDIPEQNVPRSQHLFFIALAMYPYILFYKEKAWVRLVPAMLSVAAFLFFEFSTFAIPEASSVPSHIRHYLALGVSFSACMAILALIHVIHTDLYDKDEIEHELKLAIFQDQLELFYQPQVDGEGKTIGAEALIRWKHPTQGVLSPDKFIPYAEKSGDIVPLGRWIMRTACEQLVAWQNNPLTKHLVLSVNVSAREMQEDDFVLHIAQSIEKYAVNPNNLKLEITETTLLHDLDNVIEKIRAINALGIGFSLDDFGTGYSSLSVLKDLPVNEIKIDKGFVDDITEETTELPVTDTLLSLGESMNIHSLAEGVETLAQWRYLKARGCDKFQGYFFGKPMEIDAFNQSLLAGVAKTSASIHA